MMQPALIFYGRLEKRRSTPPTWNSLSWLANALNQFVSRHGVRKIEQTYVIQRRLKANVSPPPTLQTLWYIFPMRGTPPPPRRATNHKKEQFLKMIMIHECRHFGELPVFWFSSLRRTSVQFGTSCVSNMNEWFNTNTWVFFKKKRAIAFVTWTFWALLKFLDSAASAMTNWNENK